MATAKDKHEIIYCKRSTLSCKPIMVWNITARKVTLILKVALFLKPIGSIQFLKDKEMKNPNKKAFQYYTNGLPPYVLHNE